MTRINVIPVEELQSQFLRGEYKEITRVFGYARKAQFEILRGKRKLPQEYTLGTGHVLFFYDKLGYVLQRYQQLTNEMISRGYKPNPVANDLLTAGIDSRLFKGYIPTKEAIEINMARINERLGGKE